MKWSHEEVETFTDIILRSAAEGGRIKPHDSESAASFLDFGSSSKGKQRWHRLWYCGPRKRQLREHFLGDKKAFFAVYDDHQRTIRHSLKTPEEHQDAALLAFAKSEARLSRQMHQGPLFENGKVAMDALMAALRGREIEMGGPADFVLVAIYIKKMGHEAEREGRFETARLDTRALVARTAGLQDQAEGPIRSSRRAYRGRWNRKNISRHTTRGDSAEPNAIVDTLLDISDNGSHKIILVGHGLHNEFAAMTSLGVCIHDLPFITGLIDTSRLAREYSYGCGGGLMDLLVDMDIPIKRELMHNAGYDANFTMRALLEMLYRRQAPSGTNSSIDRLHELAFEPLPLRSPHSRDRIAEEDWMVVEDWSGEEDWEDRLGGLDLLCEA